MSQLTGLVTSDYLELKFTNSVDLTTDYYKKTDIDNMLLSYNTGSYVDCNLANKVSTTGGATIPSNQKPMVIWIHRRNTHQILRTQQFIQSFGHWQHFRQGIENSGS